MPLTAPPDPSHLAVDHFHHGAVGHLDHATIGVCQAEELAIRELDDQAIVETAAVAAVVGSLRTPSVISLLIRPAGMSSESSHWRRKGGIIKTGLAAAMKPKAGGRLTRAAAKRHQGGGKASSLHSDSLRVFTNRAANLLTVGVFGLRIAFLIQMR